VGNDEDALRQHVIGKHFQEDVPLYDWERKCYGAWPQLDYYVAGIRRKEDQKMPDTGISTDRRALANAIAGTLHARSLVCFICGQVKTDTGILQKSDITLSKENAAMLDDLQRKNPQALLYNLSAGFFRDTYTKGPNEQPWRRRPEFEEKDWEWRRLFKFSRKGVADMEMLCNPEDCLHCGGDHDETTICRNCHVVMCSKCRSYLKEEAGNSMAKKSGDGLESLPFCIPMALANDNMWGYTTSVIVKYKVRWIEVAAVLPIWTSMIVYYVEGDYGHLMNETLQKPRWRTKVRGHCFSFIMPWQDIVDNMQRSHLGEEDMSSLPRDPECLKYLLRLHLKVAHKDLHKELPHVHLRPHILLLLLKELIDRRSPRIYLMPWL